MEAASATIGAAGSLLLINALNGCTKLEVDAYPVSCTLAMQRSTKWLRTWPSAFLPELDNPSVAVSL